MKTKIIATIGPSSDAPEVMAGMIEAGMNIARMNFSHCTYDEFIRRKKILNEEAGKQGKEVAILLDLQGPRIRVGELPKEGRELVKGEIVSFTVTPNPEKDVIFVDTPSLLENLSVDHPIFLSSGKMELIVRSVTEDGFTAEVIRGGMLFTRKGVNVPETRLSVSGLTPKDVADVKFGLEQGIDYIAVSFVQTAEDVATLKEMVGDKAKVVAKIESALALKNIDEIIQVSDAIMIARGDLGVEIPLERVPFVQKNLVRQAIWHRTGTIVATQMLLSMVDSPDPTRAEVSDVANAILDGSEAVMLSDETASGKYPVEAVATMAKIVEETERLFMHSERYL
jgi:pyruvate kinase